MSTLPLHDAGLDDPVRYALRNRQQTPGVHAAHCAAFRADVGPFAALDDPTDPEHWAALRTLVPGRTVVVLDVPDEHIPADWTLLHRIIGRQLVDAVSRQSEDDVAKLGDGDVPEMLDLVGRTAPGPFAERTITFGGYVGIRSPTGDLIAMAGRRMWAGDAIEISAVCADPAHRGQGLARRVVHAVSAAIQADGCLPYLHVADTSTPALGLYRAMGFVDRREVHFVVLTPTPENPTPADTRRSAHPTAI
jgi:ribosomal protein S18 acetylase RimI-like enzyme